LLPKLWTIFVADDASGGFLGVLDHLV
jgi:hypothetical protein